MDDEPAVAKRLTVQDLSVEQLEALCEAADRAVRDFVLTQINPRFVDDLDVAVDVDGSGPVTIVVDVSLSLKPSAGKVDVKRLVDAAGDRAFQAVEDRLRDFPCRSRN